MSENCRCIAVVALLFTFGLAGVALGEEPVKLPPKEKFYLFLLVGQSNMAGRGTVEEQDRQPLPRVLMLDKQNRWVPAVDPMHFDKPGIVGVGLGRSFGIEIATANPDVTVGLIPCAVGGSPIDSWKPGGYHSQTKSHPWDDALPRAKLAMQSGVLKGILWHQGESDARAGLAETYEAKLHDLIARFRKELGAADVPFVAGQMGQFTGQPWDDAKKLVDAAHRNLPKEVPHTAFVASSGLSHRGDKVHFDSKSYREFGRRYAKEYLALIKNDNDNKSPASCGEGVLADGAEVKQLADGFKFTEGPACDAAGNVYFTDQPNDRILRWSTDGKLTTFMQPCGRSNGLCFDANGNLWACADEKNELWRIAPDGDTKKVVVKDFGGKLLNGPNDIWIHPGGDVYFTDPFYKRPYWNRGPSEQDGQCVYRLSKDGKLTRAADGLEQPNGIIGTPDGRRLYVADIRAKKTYSYDIEKDGSLTGRKLFCEMGSDGMTIDNEGNVYLTGQGVTVFNADGDNIQHIPIDAGWTANVCFGGKDRDTLFITAKEHLFAIRTRVRGVGSQ